MDFLNNNYKTYIQKKDKILQHTTQASSFIFLYIMKVSILAFLVVNFLVILYLAELNIPKKFFSFKPSIIFSLLIAFFGYIKYKGIHYVITETGLYKISGVLNKKIKFVPFKKITDSSLSISLFESILNVGTINISTAGGTKFYNGNSQPYELIIRHINDYNKINQLITKHL